MPQVPVAFETYEQIWEQDARWLMGRSILGDIVRYLDGRSLMVVTDDDRPGFLKIALPMPTVLNSPNGKRVCISKLIPEELVDVFWGRVQIIVDSRLEHIKDIASLYENVLLSPGILHQINEEIRSAENQVIASGGAELWRVAADAFGV